MEKEARRWYYREAFPSTHLKTFLKLGLGNVHIQIGRSEHGQDGSEHYRRYFDLNDLDSFKCDEGIIRIDVGYEDCRSITRKRAIGLMPTRIYQKALVLDYDIDPSEKRPCCSEPKDICAVCWETHILDPARRTLGFFESLMGKEWLPVPIFSGGRGIHFWFPRSPFINQLPQAVRTGLLKDIEKQTGLVFDDMASTHLTHMIKCPFSLHDRTLRVARPIRRLKGADLSDFPSILGLSEDDRRELCVQIDQEARWLATRFTTPPSYPEIV